MSEPVVIDVRGLKCPLPVLKAAKRMAALPAGTRVLILATDPMAAIDVPHFCNENGHRLIAQGREADEMRFEIEKG
jgi:tRNA 2-thiouridine synthesizing protein A